MSSVLIISACGETPESTQEVANKNSEINNQIQTANEQVQQSAENLKSGNMFSIVRDVADVQLKAGTYITQLQETKAALQQAVNTQDTAQLATLVEQLDQQLVGFNSALESLNLKSQEIYGIRENIIQANKQILAMPLLNGQIDIKNIDLKQIEQQMGSVENEMIKLAAMFLTEKQEAQ